MDKGKAIFFGVMGLIILSTVIYLVVWLGGSDDENSQTTQNRQIEFKAPDITKEKDKFDERLKQMREEPEEEKQIEFKNPFEKEKPKKEAPKVAKLEERDLVVGIQPEKKKTAYKPKPKPRKKVPVRKEPIKKEPQIVEAEPLITKSRYNSSSSQNSIGSVTVLAVVDGTQKVFKKGNIKIRLTEALRLKDVTIPRNTYVYGEVNFKNERVQVNIRTLKYRNQIYDVKLAVYDSRDGMQGIYIPGGVSQDMATDSENEVIGGIADMAGNSETSGLINKLSGAVTRKNSATSAQIRDEHKLVLKLN